MIYACPYFWYYFYGIYNLYWTKCGTKCFWCHWTLFGITQLSLGGSTVLPLTFITFFYIVWRVLTVVILVLKILTALLLMWKYMLMVNNIWSVSRVFQSLEIKTIMWSALYFYVRGAFDKYWEKFHNFWTYWFIFIILSPT